LSGILYSYDGTNFDFSPNNRQAALVIFDDRALNFEKMVAFGCRDFSVDDAQNENRLIIKELFRISGSVYDPWPQVASATSINVVEWAKNNLVGFREDITDPPLKELLNAPP